MWIDPIFDRTQLDVNYAKYLVEKEDLIGYDNFTEEEKILWDNGLRGARSYPDLLRITGNIHYLADVLKTYGYLFVPTCKTEWMLGEIPTYLDIDKIRLDLEAIKKTFVNIEPITPSLPYTSYQKMNDVEKIIFNTEKLINNIKAAFIHSGTTYSGMEGIRI